MITAEGPYVLRVWLMDALGDPPPIVRLDSNQLDIMLTDVLFLTGPGRLRCWSASATLHFYAG